MTILEKSQAILTEKTNKIIPDNIREGVTVFGVTGNVKEIEGEIITITPSTSSQEIEPTLGNGFTRVYVDAVTSSIDNNIQPENIKAGVTILGVTGTYTGEDISL